MDSRTGLYITSTYIIRSTIYIYQLVVNHGSRSGLESTHSNFPCYTCLAWLLRQRTHVQQSIFDSFNELSETAASFLFSWKSSTETTPLQGSLRGGHEHVVRPLPSINTYVSIENCLPQQTKIRKKKKNSAWIFPWSRRSIALRCSHSQTVNDLFCYESSNKSTRRPFLFPWDFETVGSF